jgi:hypothetical protein
LSGPARVDELWAGFVTTLPPPLAYEALGLAHTLGLCPSRDVPWSEVFGHEVTLGAPGMIAEAMPDVPRGLVEDAVLAHLLAIIEAFGTDRIQDGQVTASPALEAVLAHARRARDEAVARVAGDASGGLGYAQAERETLAAITAERGILGGGEAIPFARYLAVAYDKQRLGLPASLALAQAAGWDERRKRCLARMLDAVWVALQLHDDVIDWEEDLSRGGAWATALAAHVPPVTPSRDRRTMPVSTRRLVHQSSALARMLGASARRFRAARRRAEILGVARLAAWAREREEVVGDLARHEAETPGYANRAHALSMWARSVLE